MTIATHVLPIDGELPQVGFHWDSKTGILAGTILDSRDRETNSRTVELGGSLGSYVSLNLVNDVLAGVEVVVWPKGDTVDDLEIPDAGRHGQLKVSAAGPGDQPAVVEFQAPITCTRAADESRLHLVLGSPESVEVVALADKLLAELDLSGQLAGLWLVDVPPFPDVKETD